MSAEIPTTPHQETTIQQEYLRRLDEDLARNAGAQQDAADAITRWQEHLASLQKESAWLADLKSALSQRDSALVAEQPSDQALSTGQSDEGAPVQALPSPRTARASLTGPSSRGMRTSAANRSLNTKQGTARRTPTLGSLIVELLAEHGQPQTAAEVTTALASAHPDRGSRTPVVRSTLEHLVAKSSVSRHKQGSTVYYTANNQAKATATTSSDSGPKSAGELHPREA
ncbi:BlaI/MecI/CopY family transcriptional regulator [Actinacidiphila glaucinigra]|uniref:BlaI/MecI/CopY family transcriptional regulator n=1 Tax=Actinacidiphila glaucinigra TaxID=235986 RepID=UPI0035E1CC8C